MYIEEHAGSETEVGIQRFIQKLYICMLTVAPIGGMFLILKFQFRRNNDCYNVELGVYVKANVIGTELFGIC